MKKRKCNIDFVVSKFHKNIEILRFSLYIITTGKARRRQNGSGKKQVNKKVYNILSMFTRMRQKSMFAKYLETRS